MRSLIPGAKEAGAYVHSVPRLAIGSLRVYRKQCTSLRPQAKASPAATVQVDKDEIREEPPAKLEVKHKGAKGSQDLEVDAVLAKELNENGEPMLTILCLRRLEKPITTDKGSAQYFNATSCICYPLRPFGS